MPNLCVNRLEVRGAAEELAKFTDACTKRDDETFYLDCEKIIPPPPTARSKNGHANPDWATENWGTKWVMDFETIETTATSLVIRFVSAWGPPDLVVQKIAKDFPDLSVAFDAIETGNDFSYRFEANKGITQESEPPLTEERIVFVEGEISEQEDEQLEEQLKELGAQRKRQKRYNFLQAAAWTFLFGLLYLIFRIVISS